MVGELHIKPYYWVEEVDHIKCFGHTPDRSKVFTKIIGKDLTLSALFQERNIGPYQWITIEKYCPMMDKIGDFNITTEKDHIFSSKEDKGKITLKLLYINFSNTTVNIVTTNKDCSRSYVITTDKDENIPENSVKIFVEKENEIFSKFHSLFLVFSPDRIICYDDSKNQFSKIYQGVEVIDVARYQNLGLTSDSCLRPIQENLENVCNSLKITSNELLHLERTQLVETILYRTNCKHSLVTISEPILKEKPSFSGKTFIYDYGVVYQRIMKKSKQPQVRKLAKLLKNCPSDIITSIFYSNFVDKAELNTELNKFLETNSIIFFDKTTAYSKKMIKTLNLLEIVY